MDPFLEDPVFFGDLHGALLFCVREALQAALPEPYYAAMNDRTWVEMTTRHIEPDVNVLRAERPTPEGQSAVAVAQMTATAAVVVTVPHTEGRQSYLDVYTRLGDAERLVTTIEVLSPTNKRPGERGRDLYLRKQREVLDGQVHLVEIDLLRGGTHSTAVPLGWLLDKVPVYDYHVCIHHFDNLEDFFIYPAHLDQRLPAIAVPLLPGDGAVTVDLQGAFDRAYDTGPYRRWVRYTDPVPPPALTKERQAWLTQVLRGKGLLPPPASPLKPDSDQTSTLP
jgi:hypothetical protein